MKVILLVLNKFEMETVFNMYMQIYRRVPVSFFFFFVMNVSNGHNKVIAITVPLSSGLFITGNKEDRIGKEQVYLVEMTYWNLETID